MTFAPFFPKFDLGDYILREQEERDLPEFHAYYTDPIVNEYILAEIPKTIEETRYELNYWRNIFYTNDGIYFTIAKKSDDKMIGSIGLTTFNRYHSRIELSYDMAKEYWGLGIMSASTRTLIKYTFETLKINRLEAITSTFNAPSFKLLEKCGFAYEGCLRQHRYHRGKFVDVYSFSILREEYLQNPKKYGKI
jgi:ribosomal-protein-alanine N-acetyltransferase